MTNVVIYTTDTCPFCYRALDLLNKKKIDYQQISVDGNPTLRAEMEALSGRHTVPQIFINDKPIGGCDDLYALEEKALLDKELSIG